MKSNEINEIISAHIKTGTLSHRKDMLIRIFDILDIRDYYDELERYREATPGEALDAPHVYHGKTHSHSVALNCYEAIYSTELPYSKGEKQALMIAALYHDTRHTRGRSTDTVNIMYACEALRQADSGVKKKVDREVLSKAFALIKLTQFPYTKNTEIPAARILRDADLMGIYEEDQTATDLLSGLFVETNEGRKREGLRDLKFKDFIESNTLFLQKITWQSRWGRNKALLRNFPQRIKEIRELLSIYSVE